MFPFILLLCVSALFWLSPDILVLWNKENVSLFCLFFMMIITKTKAGITG